MSFATPRPATRSTSAAASSAPPQRGRSGRRSTRARRAAPRAVAAPGPTSGAARRPDRRARAGRRRALRHASPTSDVSRHGAEPPRHGHRRRRRRSAASARVSPDRGRSWRKVALPNPTHRKRNPLRLRDADAIDARRASALDTAGRVWNTRNGGSSGTRSPRRAPATPRAWPSARRRQRLPRASRFAADRASAYVLRTERRRPDVAPAARCRSARGPGGLVAADATTAFALRLARRRAASSSATSTGGDAGQASPLSLTTKTRRFTKKGLRRAGGRSPSPARWPAPRAASRSSSPTRCEGRRLEQPVVTAGANGGSFTATFRLTRSSYFVAQWAGDSGRTGAGTRVLGVSVR